MIIRETHVFDPAETFFPVELRPIFLKNSSSVMDSKHIYTKLPRHKAVVDIERNNAFAVVTDEYKLITNRYAFELAKDVMEKVFKMTTIEDMVCFNIIMPSKRSFCHIDLIHKSADFSPWEDDKWTAFIRITNSYNRSRRLRYELGFCRWICKNGMIFGDKSIEFSYAHTKKEVENIDRFVHNIGDIRKLETKLIEELTQLKRYHVPEKQMLPILCRAFDIKVTDEVYKKQRRIESLSQMRDQVNKLTEKYFSQMGQHGYAALNVLTDYASRPEGVISQEASINRLQQKANNWMKNFIFSIQDVNFNFKKYVEEYNDTIKIINSL